MDGKLKGRLKVYLLLDNSVQAVTFKTLREVVIIPKKYIGSYLIKPLILMIIIWMIFI